MQQLISKILKKAIKKELSLDLDEKEIVSMIEIPPTTEMGDYAFPCFFLASKTKRNPSDLALQLRSEIGTASPTEFDDLMTKGPYVNFFINRKLFSTKLINQVLKEKDKYGKTDLGKSKKTMIEFVSPNTNKPLHIGHIRNMAIGKSISKLSEFNSEKVIKTNLNNDRGIHICKSMAAYEKYGKNKTPSSEKIKPDHFVGKYYAMFGAKSKTNQELERLSHRMLQKWEQGDKETIKLWEKMNKWAFDGWKQTFEDYEIKFDKEYYESKIYKKGKEIILNGFKKGIFEKKDNGAIFINLEKEKLGEKILLRMDGTSVYMTQDIYLAQHKFNQYKLDNSYYVVGNEQEYHFKVLFSILEKLGFNQKGLKHLGYGMVRLPSGKIKSREGTNGISADEILEKTKKFAKKEIESREKLSKKEVEKRSHTIALSAINYSMLKVDINRNMVFDPKASVSFEGNTGPYLLYTYARANSILEKAKYKKSLFKIKEIEDIEYALINKIYNFQKVVAKAYENLNPSLIANYSYELAQTFNEFYQNCPVINSKKEKFRLALVDSFKQTLKNSVNLLGIETLEKM